MNDKSANFLAIYYKALKHERHLSVTKPPWVCLPFFNLHCACKFANSHHASFTLYLFSILSHSSRYLTIFVHFYVGFMVFIVLLYFIISQRFSFYASTTFLWHAVSHCYNVMVSFAFFVFVRHTAHCFLLLVSCRSWMSGKVDQAEHQVVV